MEQNSSRRGSDTVRTQNEGPLEQKEGFDTAVKRYERTVDIL
jgi:hypothetical protein